MAQGQPGRDRRVHRSQCSCDVGILKCVEWSLTSRTRMVLLTRRRWPGTPRAGRVLGTHSSMHWRATRAEPPSTTYHPRTSIIYLRQSGDRIPAQRAVPLSLRFACWIFFPSGLEHAARGGLGEVPLRKRPRDVELFVGRLLLSVPPDSEFFFSLVSFGCGFHIVCPLVGKGVWEATHGRS